MTTIRTAPFPGTERIAVDRKAASQGKPPIHLLEQDRRASRVQIICPCGCEKVVAEVRWSGNTVDAPAVWVEISAHSADLRVFTDIGDR